ncbi:hypothetical protein HFD88_006310 [Aspergillus terreus]|nr:hypothetical protein HFD88_006310 [Aspergillus terreus]
MGAPDAAAAAPGQHEHEWSNSFWDCCSPTETCFLGWCFPCGLFGRTGARLEDPSMKSDDCMNGNCLIYFVSSYCALHWIPLMMKRGEIRKRFNIEGSGAGDCFSSYCCPCCTLVQNEKEVEFQSTRIQQSGYQAPAGMAYPQ